jgi:outer membrane protein assembly factor BamB
MSDKTRNNFLKSLSRENLIAILLGMVLCLLISFSMQKYLLSAKIPVSTEVSPRNIVSSSLPAELLWQIEVDESVSTAPIITENIVIVPTRLALYGLDITTGQQLWKYESGPHPSPPPIISTGKSVIYGEGNSVFALNIETGDIVWQHKIRSNDVKSIVIGQRTVYVVAQPTQIDALDIDTGKLVWSLNGYENGIETRGPSLFRRGNDLYLFTTEVHVLNAETGEIKQVIPEDLIPKQLVSDRFYADWWIREAGTLNLIAELEAPNNKSGENSCRNFKAPYAFLGNLFYAVGHCGGVYALDIKSNRIKWRYREDIAGETPIAIYKGRLYVLFDNGEIHAIDPQIGQESGVLKTNREIPGFVSDASFLSRGVVANENVLITTFNDKNVWAFCEKPCF